MTFSFERVRAIVWREGVDLGKNRGLLLSLFALPLVMVLMPVGVVYSYVRNPADPALRTLALFYDDSLPLHASAAEFLLYRSIHDWFALYLLLPVFVPILISSHAIAGEKEKRTLEPLLASPVTAGELLLGKSLASVLPACLISLVSFVLMCLCVDVVAWPLLKAPLLPDAMWLWGVFVLAPGFAFLGNGVAILVSARVGDTRLAQQVSGLVVLPVLGLAVAQVSGFVKADLTHYAWIAALVFLADALLMWLAVRLLDRERLLRPWG